MEGFVLEPVASDVNPADGLISDRISVNVAREGVLESLSMKLPKLSDDMETIFSDWTDCLGWFKEFRGVISRLARLHMSILSFNNHLSLILPMTVVFNRRNNGIFWIERRPGIEAFIKS